VGTRFERENQQAAAAERSQRQDFAKLTATDVPRGKGLLNNQPRKALKYYSHNEVFAKLTALPENYALGL